MAEMELNYIMNLFSFGRKKMKLHMLLVTKNSEDFITFSYSLLSLVVSF